MFESIKRYKRTAFIVFTVTFWLSAIYAIDFYSDLNSEHLTKQHQKAVLKEVALARAKIESSIYKEVSLADALTTLLMTNPNNTLNHWDRVANKLISNASYIRNIGLSPNDIITHIYPLKGNEAAIGLDFRTLPSQYDVVMHTRDSGQVYLDGPVTLVQGGKAVIARFPVFLDYPINSSYWGGASVVLNFDDIIHQSGLLNIDGTEVALKRVQLDGSETVFLGEPTLFEKADELIPIFLPQVEWILAVKSLNTPSPTSIFQSFQHIWSLGLIASGILYIAFILLFRAYALAHSASIRDELTNLHNRRYFFQFLNRLLTKNSSDFILYSIDLNDFKNVNDRYGHDAGDYLLKHIGRILTSLTPKGACLARVGGDEFALLIPQQSERIEAESFALKLELTVSSQTMTWKHQDLTGSLSIGYVCYDKNAPESMENLLTSADHNMYNHKRKHYQKQQYPGGHHDYII